MKDCERWQEQISALLDGELSAEEETAVRAHMAGCPECAAMYEAFAAVGAAMSAEDVPDTLHDGIMEKVRLAEKAHRTQKKIVRLRPILTAAACLVVLVGTLLALNNTVGLRRRDKETAAEAPAAAAPVPLPAESATAGGSAAADGDAPILFARKAEESAAGTFGAAESAQEIAEEPKAETAYDTFDAPAENGAISSKEAVSAPTERLDAPGEAPMYKSDEFWPSVMVNDALYAWGREDAVCADGLPDRCEYYCDILHIEQTDRTVPEQNGELAYAPMHHVAGEIYTVPGSEEAVYLRISTDSAEAVVVRFDRCE